VTFLEYIFYFSFTERSEQVSPKRQETFHKIIVAGDIDRVRMQETQENEKEKQEVKLGKRLQELRLTKE